MLKASPPIEMRQLFHRHSFDDDHIIRPESVGIYSKLVINMEMGFSHILSPNAFQSKWCRGSGRNENCQMACVQGDCVHKSVVMN